jgi:hypothetical protein
LPIIGERELEERPKSAQAGDDAGPSRASGERLDTLDKPGAGVDVDAGVAITEG